MAELDTRRIRPGPATKQYLDSCLWHVETARPRLDGAVQALEEAARLVEVLQEWELEDGERLTAVLRLAAEVSRARAAVLAAEVRLLDAGTYLRHLSGDAGSSREAREARKQGAGLNGGSPGTGEGR